MAGPTRAQIEHYVRMFEQLSDLPAGIGENLCWTVVRPHHGRLTVDEVVRRWGGDPDTVTATRPADVGYDDDMIFLEPRDDAVVVVAYDPGSVADTLPRLSAEATVHGVFWAINNFNRLYHLVDGAVVTELDVLKPLERWGTDPEALTGHLAALCDLNDSPGPGPDWETAMATVESLTGLRLDADWFFRPQLLARSKPR